MKSVLISIQPKWCELIASGKKTVEVRKTKPKIATPFKVYIYQTLHREFNGRTHSDGKVIGEFVCDKITCFTTDYRCNAEMVRKISEESCICIWDLSEYEGNSNCLWAWHISDLIIYDKPKPLSDFIRCKYPWDCGVCDYWDSLCLTCNKPIRPPQSWCYVEDHNG